MGHSPRKLPSSSVCFGRSTSLPVVPHGRGRFSGVVHRPVELLPGALPAGSGPGRPSGRLQKASSPVVRGVHEAVFICGREEPSFSKAEKPRAGSDKLVENKALERCDGCTVGRRQVEIKQSKKAEAGERLFFCLTLRPSASVLKLRCACRPYQRASVSPRTCSHQP